jgi:hypothetical protein
MGGYSSNVQHEASRLLQRITQPADDIGVQTYSIRVTAVGDTLFAAAADASHKFLYHLSPSCGVINP